jgi:hypothetical protein
MLTYDADSTNCLYLLLLDSHRQLVSYSVQPAINVPVLVKDLRSSPRRQTESFNGLSSGIWKHLHQDPGDL